MRNHNEGVHLDRESLEELRRIRQRASARRDTDGVWLDSELLVPSIVVGMFAFFFTDSLAVFVAAAAIAFVVFSLARYLIRISRISEENNMLLRELLKEREMRRVRQS